MTTVGAVVGRVLDRAITPITLRSITRRLGGLGEMRAHQLDKPERERVLSHLELCLSLFAPARKEALLELLQTALAAERGDRPASDPTVEQRCLEIRVEQDISSARLQALTEAARLGFSRFDSVKVATAVSELARNIVFYAGSGEVRLTPLRGPAGGGSLRIEAIDAGPGISADRMEQILAGSYRSERGLGKGLLAVKRLADSWHVASAPGKGTHVRCEIKAVI